MGIFRWILDKVFPVATIDGDGTYSIDVVGESHYQKNLDMLAGGRLSDGHFKTTKAVLICEDDNPYDDQAVMVTIGGKTVGYLPKRLARKYRKQLEEKGHPGIKASCGAAITGGWERGNDDRGSYGVKLDLPSLESASPAQTRQSGQKSDAVNISSSPEPSVNAEVKDKDSFVAIDVETANSDAASICQIGVAKFQGGYLVDEWTTLVDPKARFSPANIGIHGITRQDVDGAPTFSDIHEKLSRFLNGSIVVSHMPFDQRAINKAVEKFALTDFDCTWLDSAKVTRRAWEECAKKGYGLANICNIIGYEFQHHNALEDAKACGHVLLAAVKKTGITVDEWVDTVNGRITKSKRNKPKEVVNLKGHMVGEVVTFTGALSMSRVEAAALAANAGCKVTVCVTKKTTLLVVGDQDVSKLIEGSDKSSKHKKADALIASGQSIKIIQESDFVRLLELEAVC